MLCRSLASSAAALPYAEFIPPAQAAGQGAKSRGSGDLWQGPSAGTFGRDLWRGPSAGIYDPAGSRTWMLGDAS